MLIRYCSRCGRAYSDQDTHCPQCELALQGAFRTLEACFDTVIAALDGRLMARQREIAAQEEREFYRIAEVADGVLFRIRDKKVKHITIPNGVTRIANYAFDDCMNLTSLTIPESLINVDHSALGHLWHRPELTEIRYRGTLAAWCRISDNHLMSSHRIKDLYIQGKRIEGDLTIPDGVTSIGSWAFYDCSGLTTITIPESVTSIGPCAFCDCSGLTTITIPESVTSIGYSTFSGCSGLTSVMIPKSVTNMGSYAFSGCDRLLVCCAAKRRPKGWSRDWKYGLKRFRQILWGYDGSPEMLEKKKKKMQKLSKRS